jgi:hypothetical protein
VPKGKPNSVNNSDQGGTKNEKEHNNRCFMFIDGMDAFSSFGWVEGWTSTDGKRCTAKSCSPKGN